MATDSIEKLARTLAESLPQGLKSVREDVEKNFQAILKSGIEKLDLVTREEFEVQLAVLERTRRKLEALDARLAEMELPPPATSGAATRKSARKKPARKKTVKKKAAKKKTTRK